MNERYLALLLAGSVGILSACGGQVMMPDDDGGTGGTDATGGTGGHAGTGTGAMGGYAGTGAMGGYAGTGAMGGYAGTGAMGGYAGTGTGAMGGYAGTGTGAMGGYAGTGTGGGPPDCSATQDCFGCCASVYLPEMAYINKLWLGCGGCADLCLDECHQQTCQDPTMIPYDECRQCFMDTMQQHCMPELGSCLGEPACASIVQCWLACP